jgi:hypothetical protein
MKCREPQPIILPEAKSRQHSASLPPLAGYPGYNLPSSGPSCGQMAEATDCPGGHCGRPLKTKRF